MAYRVRRAIELTGEPGPESTTLQAAVTLAPLLDHDEPGEQGPGLS